MMATDGDNVGDSTGTSQVMGSDGGAYVSPEIRMELIYVYGVPEYVIQCAENKVSLFLLDIRHCVCFLYTRSWEKAELTH